MNKNSGTKIFWGKKFRKNVGKKIEKKIGGKKFKKINVGKNLGKKIVKKREKNGNKFLGKKISGKKYRKKNLRNNSAMLTSVRHLDLFSLSRTMYYLRKQSLKNNFSIHRSIVR